MTSRKNLQSNGIMVVVKRVQNIIIHNHFIYFSKNASSPTNITPEGVADVMNSFNGIGKYFLTHYNLLLFDY